MASPETEATAAAQGLVEKVKKAVKGVEVFARVNGGRDRHLRFARNGVTTSGDVERREASLTLKLGQRVATLSTSTLDRDGLEQFVTRAAAMVRVAPEDPEVQPVLGPQKYTPSPFVFDAKLADLPYSGLVDRAKALIEPSASKGLLSAGFLTAQTQFEALATSAGLSATGRATQISLSVTARTKDGKGSGRAGADSRRLDALDAAKLGAEAAETAQATAVQRKLDAGRYTVLLEPDAASNLLGFFIGSLDERSAEEGRSFFSKAGGATRVGDKLFPSHVTLMSDPQAKQTPMYSWDHEGVSLARRVWVDQGSLTNLFRTRFWAAKTKRTPTGGYGGFSLASGTATKAELIKGIKRGVLVKRCWYANLVEPKNLLVTGLTRDGTFLIEDGAIVGAVNNFRLNESAAGLLERCDAIASDDGAVEDPRVFVPSLRTNDFRFSSVSDAV